MQIVIYGQKFEIEVPPDTNEDVLELLIRPMLYFVQHSTEGTVTGRTKREAAEKMERLGVREFLVTLKKLASGEKTFPPFLLTWMVGGEIATQNLSVPFTKPTFLSGWSSGDVSAMCQRIAEVLADAITKATEGEQKPDTCLPATAGRPR
jgi:hypothetical protein